MQAFILETLLTRGWRRGGEIYWTQRDATQAGHQLIRQKLAQRVRILPTDVGLEPVLELPEPKHEGGA